MWTKEDQKQLEELQDRKAEFETAIPQPLIAFAGRIPINVRRSEIAEHLIEYADELRDLLAPFDSRGNGVEPNGDGWIKHHGGECPVDTQVAVEIKMRDGAKIQQFAGLLRWSWVDCRVDIVAYRVVSK